MYSSFLIQVTITATVQCNNNVPDEYTCSETHHEVNSPEAVHSSQGNAYHMDSNGFLTVRVIMLAHKFIGTEDGFTVPTLDILLLSMMDGMPLIASRETVSFYCANRKKQ